jgi:hypothetical protein
VARLLPSTACPGDVAWSESMNMSAVRNRSTLKTLVAFLGAGLLLSSTPAFADAVEQTFPVLQIGTRTYTNVTVTTKTKDYVFLLHSAGMGNFKVKELTPEVLEQLGYEPPKPRTNNIAVQIAKEAMAKVESPQMKEVEKHIQANLTPEMKLRLDQLQRLPPTVVIYGALGLLVTFYVFGCLCLSMICKKTGHPGGVMVWLPVLQVFPCLKAAGMSGWWFLAMFVPILNIIAQVMWCFKIVQARGKSVVVGFLLLVPLVNFLALIYLALSSDGKQEPPKQEAKITLMKLQSA